MQQTDCAMQSQDNTPHKPRLYSAYGRAVTKRLEGLFLQLILDWLPIDFL